MHGVIQWCLQEFLLAGGEDALANHLERYHIGDDLGDAVSVKLRDLLRMYFFVGGMPSPAAAYTERHDLLEVQRILASITTTLQDDFARKEGWRSSLWGRNSAAWARPSRTTRCSIGTARTRTRTQRNVSYALLSVPLYLAGQLDRLLHEHLCR